MAEHRWKRVAVLAAAGAVMGVGPMLAPSPATAQDGGDLAEACAPLAEVPEVGPRACKSLESGTWVLAQGCRRVEGMREPVCPAIDGRPVHPQAMADHESSWLHRALGLQRQLDLHVPLGEALLPHTHNSANSSAYAPSVSTLDANQVLSLTDQLRLGMRAIEIDVHWTPHPAGDAEQGGRAVVQCHGEPVATPAGTLHAGCSVDTLLIDLLREVRTWLDQPANADEVLLLYLENALDEDPAAHAAAVDAVAATLGNLVARPEPGAGCQSLPVARSKQALLDAGTRVLITGNCGPGPWTDWVFDRYPSWDESGGSTFDCAGARAAIEDFDPILVRRYEDSTWLSAMAGSGSHLDAPTIAAMVQCGVNLVGFDQLHPGDDRLPGLVWSWRTDEPNVDSTGACAALGEDGRFFADPCETPRRVACRTTSGGWAITTEPVAWSTGDATCQGDGHAGAAVPGNGWDNGLLRAAADAAGAAEVWLAYAQDGTGGWVTGIPDAPDSSATRGRSAEAPPEPPGLGGSPADPPDHRRATRGRPVAVTHATAPLLPVAALALALAIARQRRALASHHHRTGG